MRVLLEKIGGQVAVVICMKPVQLHISPSNSTGVSSVTESRRPSFSAGCCAKEFDAWVSDTRSAPAIVARIIASMIANVEDVGYAH
jgi:hypothetical protein